MYNNIGDPNLIKKWLIVNGKKILKKEMREKYYVLKSC